MRSMFLSCGAALALFAAPSLAQDQVLRGPIPDWAKVSEPLDVPDDADGMVFFRNQDTQIHLHADGQSNFVSQRIRLLHPQALQLGNLQIAWNPAVGAPIVHRLLIHRDGEKIDVLEQSDFDVLRREDQLEMATLDGILTASLRVPDLRVGDDLEIAFTTPGHDKTLGEDSFGILALADASAAGRFRLRLDWEEGEQPEIKMTPEFEKVAQRSARAIQLDFENPEAATPPRDAPPRYAWTRLLEYSDFESWPAVSRRFAPMFEQAATLQADSPLKQEAARIAAKHQSPMARAKAALELVQQQVRYIYVGLNGGNFQPAGADLTWERRFGDCKGKSVLLLALLRELDIHAELVLADNSGGDDGLEDRLPNPGLFDHVLVRAEIDGELWWLDGTLPAVAEPTLQPVFDYRWVLPLDPEGGRSLAYVDSEPYRLPQEMGLYEIDARAGFDEPARKVSTTITRGVAGLQHHMQLSALSRSQIKEAFVSALSGNAEWDAIEDVAYRYDRETGASIITISGTGPVDWEQDGSERYLTLPGGGFNPPSRRQRPGEATEIPFYNSPSYSCYATTVRLPDDTDLENWGFNSTFLQMMYGRSYYRMMEKRDDRTIRMVRGSRVEVREIKPEWAESDNQRLSAFDNSKAVVTYDPDQTAEPWGKLEPVPATYEIDWAKADAPCIPPIAMFTRAE